MENCDGLDDLLSRIGMGPWNYLIITAGTMTTALTPVYLVGSDFMNPVQKFTCNLPDDNYTRHDNSSECMMIEDYHNESRTVPCESWTYDTSVYKSTILMEWNLVCDRAWIAPLFQILYTVGAMFGSILAAVVADKYGRRSALRVGSYAIAALTIVMLLVPWFSVILVIRFLMGAINIILFSPAFILAIETCKPSWRSTVGIFFPLPFAIMMVVIAGVAYWVPNWRLMHGICAFPVLILLVMVLFIDESPRWLLVNGRLEEVMKVFQRAIKLNRTKLPQDFDLEALIMGIHQKVTGEARAQMASTEPSTFQSDETPAVNCDRCWNRSASVNVTENGTSISPEASESGTYSSPIVIENRTCFCHQKIIKLGLDDGFGPWWAGPVALFRTAVMKRVMLVLLCERCLQGIVYMGLPLSSGAFSSPYLYFALLGVMEMPAYSLTAPITKRFGRKRVIIPSFIGCGCFLFTYLIIKEAGVQNDWVHMMLVLISYLLVCTAYQVNNIFIPELVPTTMRPWATSACLLISCLGYSIVPVVTNRSYGSLSWLSPAVLGTFSIIAGSLFFLLPETNGRELLETVGDLRKRMEEERSLKLLKKSNTYGTIESSR